MAGTYLVSLDSLTFFLLQGVEFFDEKLNSLCMAWLVDHGASPAGWGGVLVLQEGYMGIGWGREGAESLVRPAAAYVDQLLCFLESWRSAGWEGDRADHVGAAW